MKKMKLVFRHETIRTLRQSDLNKLRGGVVITSDCHTEICADSGDGVCVRDSYSGCGLC